MRETSLVFRGVLAMVLVGVLVGGCTRATRPLSFYTLSSMNASVGTQSIDGFADSSRTVLGVGPVALPEAIDRPQIVTRESPNRLDLSEYHRWAGALDREIARVVAENLSLLLANEHVAAFPWDGPLQPTLRVALDIQRFDGQPGKEAALNVICTIADANHGQPVQRRRFLLREAVSQDSYESLVAAQSRLLGRLSREIAKAVRQMHPDGEKGK